MIPSRPLILRLLSSGALGATTTIAIASFQASRFDRETAHVRVAMDKDVRLQRFWRPTPGGPPRTAEAKSYTSHGAIEYLAMADRSLRGCFPTDEEFVSDSPSDFLPPQFQTYLVVSCPVGNGTDPFLQAFNSAAVCNAMYKQVRLAGWPQRSLWCQPIVVDAGTQYVQSGMRHGLLVQVPGQSLRQTLGTGSIVVPLHPMWPGFLIDTTLFAGAWSLILIAPWGIRKALRRRRNLCPHCAYDLRATPPHLPCPECGRISARKTRVEGVGRRGFLAS